MRTRVVDEPSYTHTHPPEKKEKKKIDRSIQVSLNLKLGSPKETKKRSTGWKANILTIVLQAFLLHPGRIKKIAIKMLALVAV